MACLLTTKSPIYPPIDGTAAGVEGVASDGITSDGGGARDGAATDGSVSDGGAAMA